MENNGRLSNSGEFKTTPQDLEALVDIHIPQARKAWGLGPNEPIDLAIYAHGGLTSESDAAKTAANWIPALYDRHIFPVFFMWETDAWSTLTNRLEDLFRGQPRPAGGFGENMKRWWNERLEGLFSPLGTMFWSEMKQNADAISGNEESGARLLYSLFRKLDLLKKDRIRLHLIGHSAGAVLHCHLAKRLAEDGCTFETVSFMAPAATTALFKDTLHPLLKEGAIGRYHQYHLSDAVEQQDHTCRALLDYSRSLLYLVSRSFEGGGETPILGMEKHYNALLGQLDKKALALMSCSVAPGKDTASSTHGGFDDDATTRESILNLIASVASHV